MKVFVLFVYLPDALLIHSFFYFFKKIDYLFIQFSKNSKHPGILNVIVLRGYENVAQTLGGAP